MTVRQSSTTVPYTPQQMYTLVADIEAYPKFIPWCIALRIVKKEPADQPVVMLADMIVAYKVFRERFRSQVNLRPDDMAIDAHYTDGPFEHLKTEWKFTDAPDGGCIIDFYIEFAFSNFLMQSTAHMVFEKAFSRMTDAFVARAHALYSANAETTSTS